MKTNVYNYNERFIPCSTKIKTDIRTQTDCEIINY
jgi:hypothetical protein